jgi:hypothetical protein
MSSRKMAECVENNIQQHDFDMQFHKCKEKCKKAEYQAHNTAWKAEIPAVFFVHFWRNNCCNKIINLIT